MEFQKYVERAAEAYACFGCTNDIKQAFEDGANYITNAPCWKRYPQELPQGYQKVLVYNGEVISCIYNRILDYFYFEFEGRTFKVNNVKAWMPRPDVEILKYELEI